MLMANIFVVLCIGALFIPAIAESWSFNLEEIASFSLSLCDADPLELKDILSPSERDFVSSNVQGRSIAASIPGSVHLDLISSGIIASRDPYDRFQELNMSWIPRLCWIYESEPFLLPFSPGHGAITIAFDAIDAPAIVSFNGVTLGIAQNVHRKHIFRLDDRWINSNRNVLKVQFPSSLSYAKAKAELYPYEVPATMNYHVWAEPTNRNFVRKAGSDFGWDW